MKHLHNIRSNYRKSSLSKKDVDKDPIQQFDLWLNQALESRVNEPTAMSLSTVSEDGLPSSRIVLLKAVTENGFVFFTNYLSRKGISLEQNPQAALLFFWPELERQIRIEGFVEKSPADVSDTYFQSRPFESQVGALVSQQSSEIENRAQLDNLYKEKLQELSNKKVDRPETWGGFCLSPRRIEFWQGRPSRLHDRVEYNRKNMQWNIRRLSP